MVRSRAIRRVHHVYAEATSPNEENPRVNGGFLWRAVCVSRTSRCWRGSDEAPIWVSPDWMRLFPSAENAWSAGLSRTRRELRAWPRLTAVIVSRAATSPADTNGVTVTVTVTVDIANANANARSVFSPAESGRACRNEAE